MIANRLADTASARFDDPAILETDRQWTFGQFATASTRLAEQWKQFAGRPVGVAAETFPANLAALLALDRLAAAAFVFPRQTGQAGLEAARREFRLARILGDEFTDELAFAAAGDRPAETYRPAEPAAATVVLFTSGTSGPPKPARHTWQTLAAAVHEGSRYQRRRWLLTYDPGSFAGMQIWLQALLTGGAVCVPRSTEPTDVVETLLRGGVEFASGTPTFWRVLLAAVSAGELAGARLEQITLGGEAVDQTILDRLAETFPGARICHIYASTEMGACFSVADGQAGFPATLLDEAARPCRMRIADDGQLEIRSPRAMQGYLDQSEPSHAWFATGDLVERRGDRVYFVGRKSAAVNVGGSKVHPAEVEAVIRGVPGVCDVCVSGVASSVVGQLVRADVQPADSSGLAVLRSAILTACRAQLPKFKVPAIIEFHDQLTRTKTGKLARAEE